MNIVIIGAGSWGTALAGLVNSDQSIRLWCRSESSLSEVRGKLERTAGVAQRNVVVEPLFSSSLSADDIVILAVPSAQMTTIVQQLSQQLTPPYPLIVSAAKGQQRSTFRTMSQVVNECMPEAMVAVLSGPNIAKEIAAGQPAKAVLGCTDVKSLVRLAGAVASDRFYLEMTRDVIDVELCAAMKGVFAIGAGIIVQRDWGTNFMGLLIAYGLQEISRVAGFLGISTNHVYGVAGVGDLVATCFSRDSRNFRLGYRLSEGETLEQALADVKMVAEGAMEAELITEMMSLRIKLPLFEALARIVQNPTQESFHNFKRILLEYPAS